MSQPYSSSASRAPLSLLSERLLELIPQIVWLADDCGVLVRLNSSWQRHAGTTPTSALGEKFWRFFHFDDRHALEAAWQNGVMLQESWQQRGRLQMAGGSYEWFEVMVQPVIASDPSDGTGSDDVRWLGTISRLASGMSDPQLLNGQEFLEALCENVSEGLVACNSVGQLVLFNRSAQEFHGLPPEPMNPDRWSQFYDLYNTTGEQPLATQDVPLVRALTGEKVRGAEMMIKPKGRQARSIVTNADPIVDAMGRQLGAVALMRDITVQKQLEAELIASKLTLVAQVAERTAQLAEREAQFRSTFDQSAIGCAHVGLDGYWLRMNQKLCEIVGHTHEDLLQKTFQQITHPDDLAEDLTYVERLLAGAISHYFLEKRYIRGDGVIIWARITVSLQRQISELPDQRGEPLYFIAMVEGISDRKQLEIQDAANRRALEQAKQVLEERNQELDQFVHIASHDLKAPLRGIANLSEWLEEDLAEKMSSDNREQLALMRSRVHRMENLIDGLLQYSRVGREDFATSWVDTRELLLEILDSLDPPVTFQIQIPEVMPQLQTQRLLLSQVFSNLFSNAIKHHDRDVGHIALDWVEQDDYYLFIVTDDGPGIPPQQQERMFGIFQTLSGRKSASNTGIGLALVKKIIEGGGGSIQFKPGIDRGVRCEFTWPKS